MADRIRCNWVASLSDGSTHTEKDFIDAGKPAWGSVLELLKTGLKLTGLRLQRDGITHTAPSSSKYAKFPSTAVFTLDHRRRAAMDSNGGEEFYCNYQVQVGIYLIKHWVDEKSGDTWMQILDTSKEAKT